MSLNRRQFLRQSAVLLPTAFLGPQVFLRSAQAAPPGASTRNLILVELFGGNDGFNTVVPWGVDGGTYYSEFRPGLGVPKSKVLKIGGSKVGFHPALAKMKNAYDAGRLAVCQGVSYPDPSFSHQVSQRVWHTGDVTGKSAEGWLSRWLNLYPVPSFPCAAEILGGLTGLVEGVEGFVPAIGNINHFTFPIDGWYPADGHNRKAAFEAIATALETKAGPLGSVSATGTGLVDLIDTFATIPPMSYVGKYPEHSFANGLRQVLRLMKASLGMRIFHLGYGGFDTHDDQDQGNYHKKLLSTLSRGLDGFYTDLVAQGLDQDTLVIVFSEFGRTVYQNGSKGTDHGSVGPVFVLGNAVNGGLTTPHPSMNPSKLTSNNEPPMTTDFRDVFGTMLLRWYGESPATVAHVFPGHTVTDLGFLP